MNAKERAVIECARAWRKSQDERGRGVSDWPGYPLIDAVDALDKQEADPSPPAQEPAPSAATDLGKVWPGTVVGAFGRFST